METYKYKAGVSTASKNTRDKYYQIGLANDKYDVKNYILFQKPFDFEEGEDPYAEENGIYTEANGDQCFNKVEYIKISPTIFEALVYGSLFVIDITEAKITKKFIEYSKEIFGDKLCLEMQ